LVVSKNEPFLNIFKYTIPGTITQTLQERCHQLRRRGVFICFTCLHVLSSTNTFIHKPHTNVSEQQYHTNTASDVSTVNGTAAAAPSRWLGKPSEIMPSKPGRLAHTASSYCSAACSSATSLRACASAACCFMLSAAWCRAAVLVLPGCPAGGLMLAQKR
jgi:hypothetical protein